MTRRPYDAIKRLLDVAVGGTAFVVSLPLQGVVALLVRSNLGTPVLFSQERPGRDGRPFTMYKFRTMRDLAPGRMTDEERITPFGAWLRSTSLDELPELWNVVRGDMSLVGPRPLLRTYLPLYTQRQARRHEVRPGITGLAQVQGRNSTPWAERLAWDVRYVERRSLRLDIRILIETVTVVFRREGIAEEGQTTMTNFEGAPDIDLPA